MYKVLSSVLEENKRGSGQESADLWLTTGFGYTGVLSSAPCHAGSWLANV